MSDVLSGCGNGASASHSALSITTNSLPSGQVGLAYSTTLAAAGGTAPYTWALTSGQVATGLSFSGSGTITGIPSGQASQTALTFTVTDSSSPAQTRSLNATLRVAASTVTVSIAPKRAGLTVGQMFAVAATTTDAAGVAWSASGTGCTASACGSFSPAVSLSGVSVHFTAPAAAGVYTVTATSVSDKTRSAAVAIGVTDLAGVLTYHDNLSRTGANTQEYALTPSTVTAATFGKLSSCAVDGAVYAQPLWVPNLTIAAAHHNVVFVATQHDSLYAFDADANASPCKPLWHANLLDTAHGGSSGEMPVPDYGANPVIGSGYFDITPEAGVTGTPVIDPTTGTLYVVSKSTNAATSAFFQRLHAISLTSGSEKFSGPANIAANYPGTGDGGSTTAFMARTQNQRAGLVLANGQVYIAWASHEDTAPYYGWVVGYSASNLSQVSVFNATPNAGYGGIWMSGAAPAVDASGNLFLLTGNGNFDATNTTPPNNDYGDSLLELSSTLKVEQYFTPTDQLTLNDNDADFGSGGAAILADLPASGSNPTHLIIGGGKDGNLYLFNRDHLGGLGDAGALQKLGVGNSIFSMGAYWDGTYYLAPDGSSLQAFTINPATVQLVPQAAATTAIFGFPGTAPSVSSLPDHSNGIVWALDNSLYCTTQSPGCGPTVLHALDARNLSDELWNSTEGAGNAAGNAVKFTVPTVANGKVYVGTRGNNQGGLDSTTSTPGELDIYGLLPN